MNMSEVERIDNAIMILKGREDKNVKEAHKLASNFLKSVVEGHPKNRRIKKFSHCLFIKAKTYAYDLLKSGKSKSEIGSKMHLWDVNEIVDKIEETLYTHL